MEDWSNGFLNSPDYVSKMAKAIFNFQSRDFFLPDTLRRFIARMKNKKQFRL